MPLAAGADAISSVHGFHRWHTRWEKGFKGGRQTDEEKIAVMFMILMMTGSLAGCGNTIAVPSQSAGAPAGDAQTEQEDSIQAEKTAQTGSVPGESVTTNGGTEIPLSGLTYVTDSADVPAVYYCSAITPEALVNTYDALGWAPTGKVAVKLSTGEPPASNYLAPELIKDLVQKVNGTIVECNTAYGGSRSSTAAHYQVAKDHGFTGIADVQILDENGSMTLSVNGGTRLTENLVGAAFGDYDSYLVLSHFKGHAMAGYGGAIKNISIGLGSSEGKSHIHTGGKGGSMWSADQDSFLEAMGDAGNPYRIIWEMVSGLCMSVS